MQVTVKYRKNKAGFIVKKTQEGSIVFNPKVRSFVYRLLRTKVKITHAYGIDNSCLKSDSFAHQSITEKRKQKENKKPWRLIKASKESGRKCFVLFHLGVAKI